MSWLQRLHIDKFVLILITVVIIATLFPCTGFYQTLFDYLTRFAIALLFFMHGAKLSRSALLSGIRYWQLHLLILSVTFVVFPLFGLLFSFFPTDILSPQIYLGLLYLCALPATVQSAIAYTSIAGGNVAAAICSASLSSILGVFLSPLIIGLLMQTQGGVENNWQAISDIFQQLMLPFIIGHLCRRWIGGWIEKNKKILAKTDRTSILFVVYTAFSQAVLEGIWQKINGWSIIVIILCCGLLLSAVLFLTTYLARLFKFNTENEITIVFCGSKKSLANGIPMANVLFPASLVGVMVLPLMIFHQMQLMVCAVIATRYAKRLKKAK